MQQPAEAVAGCVAALYPGLQRTAPNAYSFVLQGVVGGIEIRLYRPYVKNYDIIRCTGNPYRSSRLWDPETQQYKIAKPAYAYNQHCLCAPLIMMSPYKRVPNSDVYALDERKIGRSFPDWPGRPLGDVVNARRCPAIFCSESLHGSRWTNESYGYGWEPEDILNGNRMINPHGGGANYGFVDGHTAFFMPNGKLANSSTVFYMRTDGIDYDGNGSVGERDFMR